MYSSNWRPRQFLMVAAMSAAFLPGLGIAPMAQAETAPANVTADRKAPDARIVAPEISEVREGRVLTVFFGFDRADLTAQMRRALDRVAPQLIDQLRAGATVLVEGHTDAYGAEAYNKGLSNRRARAVGAYLRDAWQIAPSNLVFRGRGQSLPRVEGAPYNAENRRVEITVIARSAALDECPPSARGHIATSAGAHLDIDDFGGAPNPLLATRPIITQPSSNCTSN